MDTPPRARCFVSRLSLFPALTVHSRRALAAHHVTSQSTRALVIGCICLNFRFVFPRPKASFDRRTERKQVRLGNPWEIPQNPAQTLLEVRPVLSFRPAFVRISAWFLDAFLSPFARRTNATSAFNLSKAHTKRRCHNRSMALLHPTGLQMQCSGHPTRCLMAPRKCAASNSMTFAEKVSQLSNCLEV